MPRTVAIGLLATVLVRAGPPPDGGDDALQAEIGRLTHPSFEEREKATDALARRGPPALRAVLEAANSKDLELCIRARTALNRMGWPSKILMDKARAFPAELTLPFLLEALRTPAPIEDEALREAEQADLREPLLSSALRDRQDAVFAAIGILSGQPRNRVLEGIDAILADGDAPKYFAVRALGAFGGDGAKRRLRELSRDDSPTSWAAAPLLYRLGDKEPCETLIGNWKRELQQLPPDSHEAGLHLYNIACVLALSGRTDEAYAPLARALRLGQPWAWAVADPDFDALRDAPKFKEIIESARKAPPPTDEQDE